MINFHTCASYSITVKGVARVACAMEGSRGINT